MGLKALSSRLANLRFDDLPSATVYKTKLAILNFLSGSLPGADSGIAAAERTVWEAQGCTGNSVIIAHSGATSPLAAASVNAAMAQVFLQEDCHEHTISHPGVIVCPVALALGQQSHATGKELITAVVCGYEAQGRIGKGLIRDGFPRNGLRPASILAPFGAAAAAAKIMNLGSDAIANALSIAANSAGGVMEFSITGTPEICIQNAGGAKSGMMAALLAKAGVKAAPTALDGRFGVGLAFNNAACDWSALDGGANKGYEIDETFIKIYPGCGHVLPTAQGIMDIISRRSIYPDDVEKVIVGVSKNGGTFPGVDNKGPFGGTISAMMSHQFMVAAAIVKGSIDIEAIKAYGDASIAKLAERVDVRIDEEIEAKKLIGARVRVFLKDNTVLESYQNDTVPQTEQGVIDRTRKFAKPYFDDARIEEILAKAKDLENLPDVNELMTLFEA